MTDHRTIISFTVDIVVDDEFVADFDHSIDTAEILREQIENLLEVESDKIHTSSLRVQVSQGPDKGLQDGRPSVIPYQYYKRGY